MNLHAKIRDHLDRQEQAGWHIDWPEALTAIRAVLDKHAPGEGEVRHGICVENDHPTACRCDDVVIYRCPVCVMSWGDEETQHAPCETVRAIAAALEVST